ncbi:MAG: FHA domain-containing protein, partial [Gemmataceae bacterium]|nr:FHA domain-containing protein [Gemmataceae bacterium]
MPILGRHPDCDIILTADGVSGRHCKITKTPQGWVLEDLGSSNGTFVNNLKITKPTLVSTSDTITLGSVCPFPWANLAECKSPLPPPIPPKVPAPRSEVVKVIGRHPECDIVLTVDGVSGKHCMVTQQGNTWLLEDLKSSNGVFVNGNRISSPRQITSNDQITLGLSCPFPWDKLEPTKAPVYGTTYEPKGKVTQSKPSAVITAVPPAKGDSLIIGRNSSCDQVIAEPMVSARHAKIKWVTNGAIIEDLGSSNGTFVNGVKIDQPTLIKAGDIIGLGSYTFTLGGKKLEQEKKKPGYSLEARGICVQIKEKKLIHGVSFTLLAGEFAALMGPSGAGKTTLLNALNGYTPPAKGDVLLNNYDLYAHFDQFRNVLGYVPQDDVIHRELTVFEALWYSARLRLPPDYDDHEIEQRIKQVIAQLGLEGTENVLIGSPEKKGISGGQRKRVNLAMELLTDPKVLFLDEPTSGLSSEDTLQVMKVLRKLADDGRTIILTIHQPSLEAYQLLDHLVLMAKDANKPEPGRLGYFGPAYPDAVNFFNPNGVPNLKPGTDPSPDEVLRGLGKKPASEWVETYKSSNYFETYVEERANKNTQSETKNKIPQPVPDDPLRQWMVFVSRSFAIKKRDLMNSIILLAQAPVIGILVAMVLGDKASEKPTQENWLESTTAGATAIFMMAMSALWFGASNAVREIVGEWAVYRRERMVNLGIPAYVASKFTILGGLCAIQCFALLTIVSFSCGLKAGFVESYLIVFLTALIGVGIGLVLSSIAKTSEVAIAALPIILLALFILGGMIQPVNRMNGLMRFASSFDPARWAFEALVSLDNKERGTMKIPDNKSKGDAPAMKTVDFAESYFRKEKDRIEIPIIGIILIIQLGLLIAGILRILK